MKRQKSATFQKNNVDLNTLVMKIIVKSRAIVITLINMEVLYIPYVKKFLWFYTMDRTMITILL